MAAAAAAWPLLVYALSLAVFGAVHVLVELRYIDERFGARVSRLLAVSFAVLLGGVVLLRVLGILGVVPWPEKGVLEIVLVAALGAVVLPRLPLPASLLGIVVVGALLFGAWHAPLATLVLLAVLHNVTPVGFFAERLRGSARRRAMLASAIVFGVVPLLLASGVVRQGLAALGVGALDLTVLPTGPLADHLRVFVLPAWQDGPRQVDVFSAAAYLQVMHYVAVIGILPRLGAGAEDASRRRLPWPAPRVFVLVLASAAIGSLLLFAWSFRDARAGYGVLAAVHAWVEVPVLLLALAPGRRGRTT